MSALSCLNIVLFLHASAAVHETGSPGREIEAREIDITWVKVDRSWKIKHIRTVKTLH